jgi:hypothetical protein
MLLKANRIDAGVLAMWQGLPAQQYENMINSVLRARFSRLAWSGAMELQSQFGATADQISLYREARAAIDRSIDMTARADMMRTLGDEYAAMRDAVLEQPSLDSAAQLLLDMLEQDAKAVPDNRDRLAVQMQQIRKRLEDAKALQESGYAPLSRFGRYTVDVVDAAGERQYFGMYETMSEANTAARNFRLTFPDATVEQGTMSQQAYKLFAGVTPESLELFGNMLGLDSEGNEAQDKAFQEYLKLTKNNHSALKRMIHRKGTAGFSEDVGRVVANFVYSNARQAAAGLNVGSWTRQSMPSPRTRASSRIWRWACAATSGSPGRGAGRARHAVCPVPGRLAGFGIREHDPAFPGDAAMAEPVRRHEEGRCAAGPRAQGHGNQGLPVRGRPGQGPAVCRRRWVVSPRKSTS